MPTAAPTGSQVAAPGTVNLIGESVTIQNATDTANSTSLSKSSSFGISLKLNSPLIAGIQAATSLAKTATSAGSARTQAVAGVAAGLAVANSVDAAKDAVGALKDIKSITSLGSVTASIGFSKSKSTSASTDQTVVGSQIAGGDVNIIARGAGDQSTINVIGSSVTATRDLTLSAPGAIRFTSAQEIDTSTSKNKSVGVDIGVTLSASGLSPNASLNLGKGNSNGRDVTNIESVLTAGGTARVVTPGALTLEGAQLSGQRVEVQAGSLTLTSQQDTSTFRSSQTNVGVAVSADFKNADKSATNKSGFAGAGASLSFGSTRQSGDFASVQEQSGISAGSGGFDIKVAGATTLTGAVIASTADAANNQLTTGTLSATDLTNREKFKASSINLSASISGIGRPSTTTPPAGTGTNSTPNSTQVPANGQGEPTQGGNRTGTTAGLRTGLGVIAAGAPSVASASGSQSSTTVSAIASGGITVTSGDTASLGVAQTISRDTSAANEALTKQFTESKRADIAEGFAAAQALTQQVSVFFNNRASDEAAKRREAETGVRADGTVLTQGERDTALADANKLRDQFGAGSAARIAATAFSGAAGSNVAGGLGSLVQGAAVNVLQSLAATEVKKLADGLGKRDANGKLILVNGQVVPTTESEALRTALQAVVGCAGATAGSSSGCGSAAAGAAASVAFNLLLNSIEPKKVSGDKTATPTLEDSQARVNLVGTLIAAIANGAGLDAAPATTAGIIETENNAVVVINGRIVRPKQNTVVSYAEFVKGEKEYLVALKSGNRPEYNDLIGLFGSEANYIQYRALRDSDVQTLGGQAAAIGLVKQGLDYNEIAGVAAALKTTTTGDVAFVGSKTELRNYLANGGTVADLRADRKVYVDAQLNSLIDSFDLTPTQKQTLRDEYAAGAKASDIYVKGYEQSIGPVNTAIGRFASANQDELVQLQRLVDALPTSRVAVIVTAGVDIGLEVKGEQDRASIFNASEIAQNAAIAAVITRRQASSDIPPNGYRIDTINGTKVFISKPPLPEPKAGTNPEFNDPKHKVGFDGEVRLAQSIQNNVPGQVVISYGNAAGIRGADVVAVDANGNVFLYDNRVRNSGLTASGVPKTIIKEASSLGTPEARSKAIIDINASNLPPEIKRIALDNIGKGNYFGRTVGDGTGARNSTIERYIDNNRVGSPPPFPSTQTKPSVPDPLKPPTLPKGR